MITSRLHSRITRLNKFLSSAAFKNCSLLFSFSFCLTGPLFWTYFRLGWSQFWGIVGAQLFTGWMPFQFLSPTQQHQSPVGTSSRKGVLIRKFSIWFCTVDSRLMLWLQLRFDYDMTMVPLQYDYDMTTIRLRCIARACFHSMQLDTSKKLNMSIFCSSHIAVESNAYCNFDHFCHSRMHHDIIVI